MDDFSHHYHIFEARDVPTCPRGTFLEQQNHLKRRKFQETVVGAQWPSTEGSCYPPSMSDISAETLSRFFQDKVRAVCDDTSTADAPTFTNLTDTSFTSLSALLYGGGSETPHSVSAEVLFTGPPAHVHPMGVPRRVAPVHLHHVHGLLATRSAPWITERCDRHSNPQETRSWSGRRQELPSDLKLDIHLQGHRTDRCFAADRLPSDEQAPSGPLISLQTGTFHGDFLWYPGRSWLSSGDTAQITRPECSLRHSRPRHPPNKATKVVRCRWNSTRMDFIIYPRSTAIRHFQRPSIRMVSAEIRHATGISLRTASLHPVYLGCHLPLPHHLVLELTPMPTTANLTSIA